MPSPTEYTARASKVFLTLATTSQAHLSTAQLLVLREKLDSEPDTASAVTAMLQHFATEALQQTASMKNDEDTGVDELAEIAEVEEDAMRLLELASRAESTTGETRRQLNRLLEGGERLSAALDLISDSL